MSAGVALAATGDGASAKSATIHGCENNRTHVLSVRRGRSCGRGFTAVSWSRTGPRGAKGMAGLAGAVYRYNNYPNGISLGGVATVECGNTDATSQQYVAVSGGVEVGTGTGFPTTSRTTTRTADGP